MVKVATTLRDGIEQVQALIKDLEALEGIVEGPVLETVADQIGETILDYTYPFVPEDTGALAQSGKYTIEATRHGRQVVVSYGGDTPVVGKNSPAGIVVYAVDVHENTKGVTFNTDKKPQAMAHFLIAGTIAAEPEIREILINVVKDELGV